MWAALLAGCIGSVSVAKAVPSAVLRSVAGRAATLMAVRKAATVRSTPTNTTVPARRWALKTYFYLFLYSFLFVIIHASIHSTGLSMSGG